jgi:5-(carboxyamino)imidazole ribonucleotide synthase
MTLTSPGPTLGVVGGGQLGRMLGEAAAPLGVEVVVVDPTPDCPAAPVVRDQIEGDFDDADALHRLADRSDWLTYEIELADPDLLEEAGDDAGVPVHPRPGTLQTIQDKLVQNRAMEDASVPVPAYRRVDDVDALHAALDALGTPAMLKAREGGYDGRGTALIEERGDAADALAAVAGPALVEEFVEFERELAVMGCKGAAAPGDDPGDVAVDDDGAVDAFPVTETIHEDEILRATASPPRAPDDRRAAARDVALDVLDALDGRGVYGVELFDTGDAILFNEVAPRPHNSGHWTIEGCHTSQFQQHVRAVTGRPLGDTGRRAPTASANLLGGEGIEGRPPARLEGEDAIFAEPRAHLHWYGKREVYALRKMGHVTVVGERGGDVDASLARARELRDGTSFTSGGTD